MKINQFISVVLKLFCTLTTSESMQFSVDPVA